MKKKLFSPLNYKMFSSYPLPKTINRDPQAISDPVSCCLRKSMFTCTDNPDRYKIGKCTEFMSQRCAKNWDDKCDLFLVEKTSEDYTSKAANEFLKKTLEHKFCSLQNTSHCFEKATQYNPLAYEYGKMGKMDQQEGDFVYRPSNRLLNISTNNFAYGRLDSASPIKIAKCPKVCNKISDITDNDRVLNECLDRGLAQDVIQNIAENIVANKIPTSNKRLRQFIDIYIQDGSVKPGFGSVGKAPYLTTSKINTPTNSVLGMDKMYNLDENIGNYSNSLIPSELTVESPMMTSELPSLVSSPAAPTPASSPVEKFRYVDTKKQGKYNILLLLVFMAVVLYLYSK